MIRCVLTRCGGGEEQYNWQQRWVRLLRECCNTLQLTAPIQPRIRLQPTVPGFMPKANHRILYVLRDDVRFLGTPEQIPGATSS